MPDQEALLERLLARHSDAVAVEPRAGALTLIRRDQLLVAGHDLPVVDDAVRHWCDSPPCDGLDTGAGVVRLRMRAGAKVDVCDLAARLRGGGPHRPLCVSPNHLVHGQPLWWSGPADRPRPRPPLAAPARSVPGAVRREVVVAVLDTGLSPHPWYDALDWYAEQRSEAAEVLDADGDSLLDPQAGHGTFVAGVVLQRAPTARIRASRVIGGDGVGDELAVIRALARLTRWGQADLVNLSLGCHTYDDRPSPALVQAVAALRATGRTVVVACAGNTGGERPFWPAALKQVVGVAALDGDERAWFSNHGWWVDACAQGVDVPSCFACFDGPRAPGDGRGHDPDRFEGYATWSGTSFAAPAVTGAIAALAADEGLSAGEAAGRVLDPVTARVRPELGVVVP